MANSLLFLALVDIYKYPESLQNEVEKGTIAQAKTKLPGVEILNIDQFIALYNEDQFNVDNTHLFRIV